MLLAGSKDFRAYTAEILKAEGFNEFITDSTESKKINRSFLAQFDLVILTEQPDQAHARLFGIEKLPGTAFLYDLPRIAGNGSVHRRMGRHFK